jgi:hypothetical protein
MDIKLPSAWYLWYHRPNDPDYTLKGYIPIGKIETVDDFWRMTDTIQRNACESGMFFLMRDGYRPCWDAPENDRGGAWSKKVDAADTYNVFVDCMVHCIAESFLKTHKETLAGVSLSPKGAFHIIKIWNTNSAISDRRLLSPTLKMRLGDDIAYKAHNMRPK